MVAIKAEDTANYAIDDGVDTIDLTGATIVYVDATKIATITLADGDRPASDEPALTTRLSTTDTYTVDVDNLHDLAANQILDGEVESGVIAAGDVAVPTLSTVIQKLSVDPTGKTVDVEYSEAVDKSEAETPTNYDLNGTTNPTSATLQADDVTVRLVFASAVTPGTDTLDVAGAAVTDLAGNTLAAVAGRAITGDDSTPPTITLAAITTASGVDNDTIAVTLMRVW